MWTMHLVPLSSQVLAKFVYKFCVVDSFKNSSQWSLPPFIHALVNHPFFVSGLDLVTHFWCIASGKSDGMWLCELGYKSLALPSCLHSFSGSSHSLALMKQAAMCELLYEKAHKARDWGQPLANSCEEVIPANNHVSELGNETFPSQTPKKTLIAACDAETKNLLKWHLDFWLIYYPVR